MDEFQWLRSFALGLPETHEEPHFGKAAFCVKGKIFLSVPEEGGQITVKLTLEEQAIFTQAEGIEAVPNKWGQKGWTNVISGKLTPELLKTVVAVAYCTVAPARLAEIIRKEFLEE